MHWPEAWTPAWLVGRLVASSGWLGRDGEARQREAGQMGRHEPQTPNPSQHPTPSTQSWPLPLGNPVSWAPSRDTPRTDEGVWTGLYFYRVMSILHTFCIIHTILHFVLSLHSLRYHRRLFRRGGGRLTLLMETSGLSPSKGGRSGHSCTVPALARHPDLPRSPSPVLNR